MNQGERGGRFAEWMAGTCAGEDQRILSVVPGHARIVPNSGTQKVVALITAVCKQFGPIRRPLFVHVTAAALPGNGGGKNYYVCSVAEASHKSSRRRARQMFSYFE